MAKSQSIIPNQKSKQQQQSLLAEVSYPIEKQFAWDLLLYSCTCVLKHIARRTIYSIMSDWKMIHATTTTTYTHLLILFILLYFTSAQTAYFFFFNFQLISEMLNKSKIETRATRNLCVSVAKPLLAIHCTTNNNIRHKKKKTYIISFNWCERSTRHFLHMTECPWTNDRDCCWSCVTELLAGIDHTIDTLYTSIKFWHCWHVSETDWLLIIVISSLCVYYRQLFLHWCGNICVFIEALSGGLSVKSSTKDLRLIW